MVYFVSDPGISVKVFFTDMVNSILSNAWYKERKDKIQAENLRVISAATRLLLNEMRCTFFETELYPTDKEIISETDFLPPMLKHFMRLLVGSEIKQAAIGQSLTKPIKLKSVIPPLLFGLGVKMDRTVGS